MSHIMPETGTRGSPTGFSPEVFACMKPKDLSVDAFGKIYAIVKANALASEQTVDLEFLLSKRLTFVSPHEGNPAAAHEATARILHEDVNAIQRQTFIVYPEIGYIGELNAVTVWTVIARHIPNTTRFL